MGVPGPAGACPDEGLRATSGNVLGAVTQRQRCVSFSTGLGPFHRPGILVPGPVLSRKDGQTPSSSLPETSLCSGSATTRTLRFSFAPEHDPSHPGLLGTQQERQLLGVPSFGNFNCAAAISTCCTP